MMPNWKLPPLNRSAPLPALLALICAVFVWTSVRDLSDLSSRLAGPEPSGASEETPPASPQRILSDELDSFTLTWFGRSPESVQEIVRVPEVVRVVEDPAAAISTPSAVPPPDMSSTLPSMKLSGVFMGDRIHEVLLDVGGEKRRVEVGQEVGGWRLVGMEKSSAVFESPSGRMETVKLFPNAP